MSRTHTCGDLRAADQGKEVVLCGWVNTLRDRGQLLWIDLRDRYGLTQLVIESTASAPLLFEQARALGREYVIAAQGRVALRQAPNPSLPTGEVEVVLEKLTLLNSAVLPPFLIADQTDGKEALRMAYRYLDLRRPVMQRRLGLRHKLVRYLRSFLDQQGFWEIETPQLIRSTPEGARDFVVPARREEGAFYALPQSPQTLKQLLMIGGVDRYYQLARCFRDEDLRSDRQPEFTQLDCELSFVTQEEIMTLFSGLFDELFREFLGSPLAPLPTMTHAQALDTYGTDRPDLRWGMPILDLTPWLQGKGFAPFDQAERIAGLCIKKGARWSRSKRDRLAAQAKELGGKALFYVRYTRPIQATFKGPFTAEQWQAWGQAWGAEQGDLLLLTADQWPELRQCLGELRLAIAQAESTPPGQPFAGVWVKDFPLFAWDSAEQRYQAEHHPFTAPHPADIDLLDHDPKRVRAQAYDLVINGVEIGGGSIRNHTPALQQRCFAHLGFTPKEVQHAFGFLMKALTYGAPPHGGIAFGLDRLCMLLDGGASIRDYIAFPKNNAGRDVMLGAPSPLA